MTSIEVAMVTVGFSTVIGIVSFVMGNNKSESRHRSRVYTRLDEVKGEMEGTYVRKDICTERTKRIEEKLDKLLELNGIRRQI